MRKSGIIILTVALISFAASYVTLVNAYYNVKQEGNSIVGYPWTFKATTDDLTVDNVVFEYSFGNPPSQVPYPDAAHNKITVTGAQPWIATIIPDKPGLYFLVVRFYAGNVLRSSTTHEEQIDYFHVEQTVPEAPVFGTIGITVVMLIALLAIVYVKKRNMAK